MFTVVSAQYVNVFFASNGHRTAFVKAYSLAVSCSFPDKSTAPRISVTSIKSAYFSVTSYEKLTDSVTVPLLSTGYNTAPLAFILTASAKTGSL